MNKKEPCSSQENGTAASRKIKEIEAERIKYLISLIPYGKENQISMKELVAHTGIKDRELRDLILKARIEYGYIIISHIGKGGYWRPESISKCKDDILHYYRIARKKGVTSLRIAQKVKKALRSEGIEVKG